MEPEAIEEGLRRVVGRVLNRADAREIALDTDLRDAGLDSVRIINLVLGVEGEFGITFTDDLLTAGTFRSLSTLGAAVASLGATPAP